MYLGEITRNVILSLVDASPPLLFTGLSTPTLNTQYGIDITSCVRGLEWEGLARCGRHP